MELIDRYVAEVGRRLPEKNRLDIEKEIRSSLEDALEDRLRGETGEPSEEVVLNLLKEMGPPEKVAASYLPPRYLIGPTLYPAFITVLRIALVVVAVIAAIGFGITLSQSARQLSDVGSIVLQALAGVWSSVVQVFGIIVLVFAILEQVLPKGIQTEKAWDPRTLKTLTKPEQIKPGELIGEIVFTLLVLILFTAYPEKIGVYFYTESAGRWSFIPVLTAEFYTYIPWLALSWVLDISRNVLVLYQGRWTTATRWFSVACSLFSLILLILMLTGPTLVQLAPQALTALPGIELAPETISLGNNALNGAVRLLLGLLIVLELIELVKTLRRLLEKRTSPKAV